MAFFLPSRTQTNRELAPEGTHLAICYSVIALGTQRTDFDDKERFEVRITWELCNEFNANGWPFQVSKVYNFSGHARSNLVLDLEAWRGQEVDEHFDLEELIGLVAELGIQHKSGRNGDYAALTSVTAPPKGVERRRTPRTVPILFSFSPYDAAVYASLPEWLQKKIATSREYRIATGEVSPALPERRRQALPLPSSSSSSIRGDLDDEIPF